MKTLTYAGIGSRKTPTQMLDRMVSIGHYLAERGWTLRSGFAEGADTAFYKGAMFANGEAEIFIPWSGFNGAPKNDPKFIVPKFSSELLTLAAEYHPAWDRCSAAVSKLHARNGCQILGLDLKTPADMVVCWTPGGVPSGGTGQALRIARAYNVPVFNLAVPGIEAKLISFIYGTEDRNQ